jgi:DNA-binding transcriptional ArsR family regulator
MEGHSTTAARYAATFAAMGSEARLSIMRLLLAAHPEGLVAGELQSELGIPASTLSHHLEKLRAQDLVRVRRDRQFLWYAADTETLGELLQFLYQECCSRNRVVEPKQFIHIKGSKR